MIPIVCPAYLPNVQYCNWILQQQQIHFTGSTTYQKQTFRNRSEIYGANGKLKLTVPIRHTHGIQKSLDQEVSIAYDTDWQKQHWKSICAAYRSAPYFEFYEADL
ncbi:WbqC family protein, partial [Flavobacteriaceae bacterium]|nr:WbqC family protein [Flavobacteriaceae bacterium]